MNEVLRVSRFPDHAERHLQDPHPGGNGRAADDGRVVLTDADTYSGPREQSICDAHAAGDGVSGTHFLAARQSEPVAHDEIVRSYRGSISVPER